MRQALILRPQVTLPDVRNAVAHLDVPAFVRKTRHLITHPHEDRDDDEGSQLVRALLRVPFGSGPTVRERIAPYVEAGVGDDWLKVILSLRVRGVSSLAHPDAIVAEEYVFVDAELWPAPALRARHRLLRPRARTLGVDFERRPSSAATAAAAPAPSVRSADANYNALVEDLVARVRRTLGGDAFLAPDPVSRSLSVLTATVAAVLGEPACMRSAARKRVVHFDAYRRLFEALHLDQYFDVAREILERDHPHRRVVSAPWPPGEGTEDADLGILLNEGAYLRISGAARLRLLPSPVLMAPVAP